MLRQALAETSHDIGKNAALGTAEGVAEAAKKDEHNLARLALEILSTTTFLALLAGLTVVLLGALVWLLRQRRDARRYRERADRRTAIAAALLENADTQEPTLQKLLAQVAELLTEDLAVGPEKPRPTPPRGTLRHA